jgi:hypothetical protein
VFFSYISNPFPNALLCIAVELKAIEHAFTTAFFVRLKNITRFKTRYFVHGLFLRSTLDPNAPSPF